MEDIRKAIKQARRPGGKQGDRKARRQSGIKGAETASKHTRRQCGSDARRQ